jgi:hypothetical protein
MKETPREENLSAPVSFSERIGKAESQVDKMDELYEIFYGDDEICLEEIKETRNKIGKREGAESEKDLAIMNKVFAEDIFLRILQNASDKEFEYYKESFQTELNIASIQHMQGEDVSKKIKRIRNRFILIETAKQYRGA